MLLIVNHKANIGYKEIIKYEKQIRKMNLIILPTLCYLNIFKKGKYILGAQDISRFEEGNRTGEINANQLKELKVKYVLVGHIDRVEYNYETKKIIKDKLNRCKEKELNPLYCIGETKEDYTEEIVKDIDMYFDVYKDAKECIFVYEPKKNIGNDKADFSKIEEVIKFIKEYTITKYNSTPQIIYGGGVRIENIDFIKSINEIKGIIISKKSLKINDLKEIYEKTK